MRDVRCNHCPPALVEMIKEGLIVRELGRISAGLECTYCGTVWGVVVRPLEGVNRLDVLDQIRAAPHAVYEVPNA